MKKIVFIFTIIVATIQLHAQEFQGMAVYESKTSTSDFKNRMPPNRDITPEMQKNMEERMKKMFEKTFILNFDKSASIYKEEEKLESPGQDGGGGMRMMNSMMGSGGIFYKNVKNKAYTVDKEFMGKEFLIKDSLPNLKWKLEGETKVIGGYNCFKATAVRVVSKTDFRNFRPKDDKKDDEKKSDDMKLDDKDKKTSFMSNIEIPKEVIVTAWYTPEIPVNQGPENYWGLPGLILEINDGRTTILCSKVVLNIKQKVEIKESTKGKVVSQNDYDAIVIKKMEELAEMRERNRGNGGGMPPMR
ncbi:GLPGLI family protein [Flavobacterium sp. 5]|uniref:GLPGLI family protein n=1 Tax=Flavobacterium sp. 5 TaxID=2035199 RepID=UPI000C2B9326|nr:GLPGLI family protein [Flavobacterium sp. 5]PKB17171.1 GLPGLI family protein [Flavobacterium sp. 5]